MIRLPIFAPLLALGMFAVSAPAHADARLVEHFYNPDEVVRIQGQTNVQATIAFADDEQIENVAVGDSSSWQITPNKRANLLFVKPLSNKARTNMTVVTDQRTYLFDLVAGTRAQPLYVLRFTYPEPIVAPEAELAAETAGGPNAIELQAAKDPYAVLDPARLNFAWASKGDRKLLPARTFDDGQATFLAWPAGEPVPAILIVNEKGVEGPVNFAVRDDVIVVDGVPDLIILRSGKDRAELINQGPARPTGEVPGMALADNERSN